MSYREFIGKKKSKISIYGKMIEALSSAIDSDLKELKEADPDEYDLILDRIEFCRSRRTKLIRKRQRSKSFVNFCWYFEADE